PDRHPGCGPAGGVGFCRGPLRGCVAAPAPAQEETDTRERASGPPHNGGSGGRHGASAAVEPVTVIMLNSWVRQRVGQAPSGGGVTAAGPLRLWGGGEAFLLSHPRPQTFRSRCCQKTCCSQWVPAGALWRRSEERRVGEEGCCGYARRSSRSSARRARVRRRRRY